LNEHTEELLNLLSGDSKPINVVVMPDFFMDRLINVGLDAIEFSKMLQDIVARKGGSLDQIPSIDQKGGNAINVASALLALGATVTPIVCTNNFGLEQVRFHLKGYPADFSHMKVSSKASLTTALEFQGSNGKANVMLRDLGSLAEFGPSNLNESDFKAIKDADYVCLFNWTGTLHFGTELAQIVFEHAKKSSKCKTFYDTADPLPNKGKIPELIEKVLKSKNLDILSLNENEAVAFASLLSTEVVKKKGKVKFNELALMSAQMLAAIIPARVDLHTTSFAVSIVDGKAVLVPSFKVQPLRATGAGDAWDAGNLIGDANGLSDQARLMLANAVSAYYLMSQDGEYPSKQQLYKFLKTM
jgi:ribokinase